MKQKLWLVTTLALFLCLTASTFAKSMPNQFFTPKPVNSSAKGAADTILFDDFETDTMGWSTMDMSSQTPKWHIDTYQAYQGKSWWCGSSTEVEGWATPPGYGDGWAQFLISPDFDLTGVASDSVLFSMWHSFNMEGPAFPNDWDCISVWADTTGDSLWHFDNWINITPDTMRFPGTAYTVSHPYAWTFTGLSPDGVPIYGWAGNSTGWIQGGFDLTPFKGKHVRVCFIGASDAAASDQSLNMNFHGMWYLDNLQVDTVSAGGAAGAIFYEDCESGPGAWRATGKTPKINWHRTTRRSNSATHAWYCGSEATGKYSWGQSDAMVSPLIDLTPVSNAVPCLADFKVWADVPDNGQDANKYNDWWRIDVSPDSGRNWVALGAGVLIDSSKTWRDHSSLFNINLAAYIGKVIMIRIGMGSDGDNHVGEGLYVDDFIVTGKTRDPLPPVRTVLLVDNDGGAIDMAANSWSKYFESSLANNGYYYSVATIGANKTMTPDYLAKFPAIIWNLGCNYDTKFSASYKALLANDESILRSYLDNGGKLWISSQMYLPFSNLDTSIHPNIWSNYLHVAPDNGWVNSPTEFAKGVASDPIGDGLFLPLSYEYLNGDNTVWADMWNAYSLMPDPAVPNTFGFLADSNSGTDSTNEYVGLRNWDGTADGYKLVFTSFPFEAINNQADRDTLTARILKWLLVASPEYNPPAVPSGLTVTQNYDSVICSWNANSEPDLAGYNVYRAIQVGLPVWVKIGSVAAPNFVDKNITPGTIYHYAVKSYDNKKPANESAFSRWFYLQAQPWKSGVTEGQEAGVPKTFNLCQNMPNPFNGQITNIEFALPAESSVKLAVYNITGQQIATLVDGSYKPGYHNAKWNGRDNSGKMAAAGIYFYRLEANASNGQKFSRTKRLNLVK